MPGTYTLVNAGRSIKAGHTQQAVCGAGRFRDTDDDAIQPEHDQVKHSTSTWKEQTGRGGVLEETGLLAFG